MTKRVAVETAERSVSAKRRKKAPCRSEVAAWCAVARPAHFQLAGTPLTLDKDNVPSEWSRRQVAEFLKPRPYSSLLPELRLTGLDGAKLLAYTVPPECLALEASILGAVRRDMAELSDWNAEALDYFVLQGDRVHATLITADEAAEPLALALGAAGLWLPRVLCEVVASYATYCPPEATDELPDRPCTLEGLKLLATFGALRKVRLIHHWTRQGSPGQPLRLGWVAEDSCQVATEPDAFGFWGPGGPDAETYFCARHLAEVPDASIWRVSCLSHSPRRFEIFDGLREGATVTYTRRPQEYQYYC